ncbi:uncharacterized protein LOC143212189 [Lasioglossum baleicum]|uniref:uncharacterized protein LOC143212189 n=1 Tax=Lasioglossum baleicum TaxID=434251 RepID=UPI003FCE9C09
MQQYNNQRKLKSFKMRLALANKFIKDNSLKRFDKLNPAQKLFVQMQLCNVDKKAKYKSNVDQSIVHIGRRFSTSEKILALTIMKSGKCYRLLSELVHITQSKYFKRINQESVARYRHKSCDYGSFKKSDIRNER